VTHSTPTMGKTPPRKPVRKHVAAAAKASSSRRRRKRSMASDTPIRVGGIGSRAAANSPTLKNKSGSPKKKGSPQGEASSRILDGAADVAGMGASSSPREDFMLTSPTRAAGVVVRGGGGGRGSGPRSTSSDGASPENSWVLWMALSAEEKRAKGSRKMYNAKQLAWRKKRRDREREDARKERQAKRAAALRARARHKQRQSKLKAKAKAKAKAKVKTEIKSLRVNKTRLGGEASLMDASHGATPEDAVVVAVSLSTGKQVSEPHTETSITTSSSLSEPPSSVLTLPPLASSQPLRGTSEPSILQMRTEQSKHSKSPDMMLNAPNHQSRSRLQRISISRDNSEQVYKDFNKLLFAQDDHKARLFAEQFRGGNPYMKSRKNVPETSALTLPGRSGENAPIATATASRSAKELRALQTLAGKLDRQGNLHCQSRKCGAVVTFVSDIDSFVSCTQCGHLNNRKSFKHVDAPRTQVSSQTKFPPTHAELCREKFTRKLRHRFIDQLNDVIHHIGDSAKAGRSPQKRIWKEFDNTQLRLVHPWKAPAAPGAKYDIAFGEGPNYRRTLSHVKSTPTFTLYAKRHQMRFDNDPDSPER
jgi:hypothetical protein